MSFKVQRIANMIFLGTDDQVWKAWHEADFTEKKLQNAWNKIKSNFTEEPTLERLGF